MILPPSARKMHQFYAAADREGHAKQPEAELWESTLRDALNTIATGKARGLNTGYENTGTKHVKRVSKALQEDLAWLASDDFFTGSFLWICEILGLSAEYIRENMADYNRGGQPRIKAGPTRMKLGMGPRTKVVVPRKYKTRREKALAREAVAG